jgi:hypothetical protein
MDRGDAQYVTCKVTGPGVANSWRYSRSKLAIWGVYNFINVRSTMESTRIGLLLTLYRSENGIANNFGYRCATAAKLRRHVVGHVMYLVEEYWSSGSRFGYGRRYRTLSPTIETLPIWYRQYLLLQ